MKPKHIAIIILVLIAGGVSYFAYVRQSTKLGYGSSSNPCLQHMIDDVTFKDLGPPPARLGLDIISPVANSSIKIGSTVKFIIQPKSDFKISQVTLSGYKAFTIKQESGKTPPFTYDVNIPNNTQSGLYVFSAEGVTDEKCPVVSFSQNYNVVR